MRHLFVLVCICMATFIPVTVHAETLPYKERQEKRMELYKEIESVTNIPWYYYAAIDSYDRGLRKARRDLVNESGLIAILFSREKWAGLTNPNKNDINQVTIDLFHGIGTDGDQDGLAEQDNDKDLLYTLGSYLLSYGTEEKDIQQALLDHYQREKTVDIIFGHVKVYKTFGTNQFEESSFPVPLRYNYSYKNTWGDARGWGGRRMHEGTDIFAGYGTPVKATAYGIVELKGWNKFGGWRIGIRDTENVYHYFAHLSGFEKSIEVGTVVKPGTVIGYVGSSGYGKPGTSGKFPPHLHYGMYRDNGRIEWSFDPYPSLKRWEKQDRLKGKKVK